MAYGRSSSRRSSGGYTRRYARRAPARRVSRSGGSRRTSTRRSSGGSRSRGGELRIVIEQAGQSSVSRYPGIAAKLDPQPKKAKF